MRIKITNRSLLRQEPPTEARTSDWHVNWPTIDKKL